MHRQVIDVASETVNTYILYEGQSISNETFSIAFVFL